MSSLEQQIVELNHRQEVEIGDVLRVYGDVYRQQYALSAEQTSVMRDLMQCRTAALGGHVDVCTHCESLRIAYNSCRNRHCPKCGTLAKLEWLEKQKQNLLPVPYFHVVFTIDHDFNAIARVNQRAMYNLLFQSAAGTLKMFGRRELGGEIGFTAVLHTWGQTMNQHIHLHCLVTGGALSGDGKRWRAAKEGFLFAAEGVSSTFRERFCDGVERLNRQGKLQFVGQSTEYTDARKFGQLIDAAAEKAWQVYIQPPLGDASHVLDYLGRYMNRTAISNSRIIAIDKGEVTFTWKDYKANREQKVMRLSAVEFIRRFLQHVLPKGFVRIRHYGILAPKQRQKKLAQCRRLIGYLAQKVVRTRAELLTAMFERDPQQCELCGEGQWQRYEELPAHPTRRKWVLAVT